ncbi:hypothetical protein AMTR_s00097p00142860 [Amborella trichopoda]|uniref:Uncharacterized protein n=1 Tax=Amborella trichopoda TaxID=13333 RepID=W1P1G9_AMBTC|nr:hypothetical protein AMTR_s00097p00142860 [Amborella trichopoda]
MVAAKQAIYVPTEEPQHMKHSAFPTQEVPSRVMILDKLAVDLKSWATVKIHRQGHPIAYVDKDILQLLSSLALCLFIKSLNFHGAAQIPYGF